MAIYHIISVFRNMVWTQLAARSLDPEKFLDAHKCATTSARNPKDHILGVVGLGNIGYTIARKAFACFEMDVHYHDLYRKTAEQESAIKATYHDTLDELLSIADCVVLATPFGGETLITAEVLSKFKEGSRLVNIARGGLVDEDALVAALESGHIFAAGLDVHANEPHVHPKLAQMRQVNVTCHNAGGAIDTNIGFERLSMENVRSVLEGKGPLTPVNAHFIAKQ
jgi:lactate dehydrogenase-like 2-hydroxyacid dehydrogenase